MIFHSKEFTVSKLTMLELVVLLVLSYNLAPALALASLPLDTCWAEGQTCDIGPDNFLSAQAGVETLLDCQEICIEDQSCEFITYFSAESFPLKNYCMLFSDCTTLSQCKDCTTGVELCFEQCGQKLEGVLAENVLEIIPGVDDELDCKAICRNQSATRIRSGGPMRAH